MFKKNKNVSVFKENEMIKIENHSGEVQLLEIKRPIFTFNKPLLLETNIVKLNGKRPKVNILGTRKNITHSINVNGTSYIEKTHKITYLNIEVPAKTTFYLEKFCIQKNSQKEKINSISETSKSKMLIISNMYNNYRPFLETLFKNIDYKKYEIIITNDNSDVSLFNIDDLNIKIWPYGLLRQQLIEKDVEDILILGLNTKISQVLDAIDKTRKTINIIFDKNTIDLLYNSGNLDYQEFTFPEEEKKINKEMERYISRFVRYNNIRFIFDSKEIRNIITEKFQIKNSHLYKMNFSIAKSKKVYDLFYINNFNKNNYLDIMRDIKSIYDLAKVKKFELNILIAGFGEYFEELTNLLRNLKNIKFEKIDNDNQLINFFNNSKKIYMASSKFLNNNIVSLCKNYNVEILNYNGDLINDDEYIDIILSKKLEYKYPVLNGKYKNPILSIVIPSYNCEHFLLNTVLSIQMCKNNYKIEIVIVNDGSKDRTAIVGKKLDEKYKNVVLIDKENGGHGSTINKGIEVAKGKYFRLLDGDDYYDSDSLDKMISNLEKETSDVILTNLVNDYALDAYIERTRYYKNLIPYENYDIELMSNKVYGFRHVGIFLSTCTYKTELLKKANFKIDHNCFYVDMEYNMIGYMVSKTVKYYPLDIYYYYLGRSGQSVSKESLIKNYKHHEKVLIRCIEELDKRRNLLSKNKIDYLMNNLIVNLINTNYMIILDYMDNKKLFREFNKKIMKYESIMSHPNINYKYKLLSKTNGNFRKVIELFIRLKNLIKK